LREILAPVTTATLKIYLKNYLTGDIKSETGRLYSCTNKS